LIPPYFWKGTWTPGEYQVWLRVETKAGAPITWVLYPYERGQDAPKVERIAGGKGVRVTLGEESEEIYLATSPAEGQNGQVTVGRNGKTHVVLPPHAVGKLGIIPHAPLRHLTAED
jgi:hypothetical protein